MPEPGWLTGQTEAGRKREGKKNEIRSEGKVW